LSSAGQVVAGKRIVIPVYNAAGLAPTKVASLPDKTSNLPKMRLMEGAKPAAAAKAEPEGAHPPRPDRQGDAAEA
jgi:hypothetical protein